MSTGISLGSTVSGTIATYFTIGTNDKLVNNLGPQVSYPVPEGILNYNGRNDIGLTLWAQDKEGARLGGIDLVPAAVIRSGYHKPGSAPQPTWTQRDGAY